MTIDARTTSKRARDRGRALYRFTGDQVLKMIETGIIEGADVELWDGHGPTRPPTTALAGRGANT